MITHPFRYFPASVKSSCAKNTQTRPKKEIFKIMCATQLMKRFIESTLLLINYNKYLSVDLI